MDCADVLWGIFFICLGIVAFFCICFILIALTAKACKALGLIEEGSYYRPSQTYYRDRTPDINVTLDQNADREINAMRASEAEMKLSMPNPPHIDDGWSKEVGSNLEELFRL